MWYKVSSNDKTLHLIQLDVEQDVVQGTNGVQEPSPRPNQGQTKRSETRP